MFISDEPASAATSLVIAGCELTIAESSPPTLVAMAPFKLAQSVVLLFDVVSWHTERKGRRPLRVGIPIPHLAGPNCGRGLLDRPHDFVPVVARKAHADSDLGIDPRLVDRLILSAPE